jgi:hypothetical protein
MKTTLFVDPNGEHELIAELRTARTAHAERYPHAAPGRFTFRGEAWKETANGYGLAISRSIRDIPLVLQEVPLYLIELEDTVEDLRGDKRLVEGIYEADGIRAEVDSYAITVKALTYLRYTVKIEGNHLGVVNDLYAAIRQGRAIPTTLWDLIAPLH